MQDTWVWSLGQEDPLEKKMATHSSILVRRIPWTEEPGGLWSVGLQRVRHEWSDFTWIHVAVNSYNHKKQALPSSNLHSNGRNREQSNRDGYNSLGLPCRVECVRGAWGRGVAVTAVVAWSTAVAVEMETKDRLGIRSEIELQISSKPYGRRPWSDFLEEDRDGDLGAGVPWGVFSECLWWSEGSRRDQSEKLNCAYNRGLLSGSQREGWSWAGPSDTFQIEVRTGWVFVLIKDQSLEMGCSRRVHLGQAAHFWTSWRGTQLGVVRNQLSAVRHLGPNWGIWWRITPSTREYVALAP